MGSLTRKLPKSLIAIQGKPFIQYQLELLARSGFTEVVLCIGHLGGEIVKFVGDGGKWGLRINYSGEQERLLGTGGAVKKAEDILQERFFVMYGDSYLPVPFDDIMAVSERAGKLATMVVYRNENRYDRSNVIVDDGVVKLYDKKARLPEMVHIDAGISVLRKGALACAPSSEVFPLEELYQKLVGMGEMGAYETQQRFYEVGSPRGLDEFRTLVAAGDLQL